MTTTHLAPARGVQSPRAKAISAFTPEVDRFTNTSQHRRGIVRACSLRAVRLAPMPITARIVYPVAVGGVAVAAVLNAISWLPVDVSGFTPVWAALFVGVFPVWIPVVVFFVREQNAYRASMPPRHWYQRGARLPWRRFFVGVPTWMRLTGALVAAYVFINFFASIALLPGQPEAAGGQYWFNDHGLRIATDYQGYLAGLRYQMRIFTGNPMIFYGVAALATYGRRDVAVNDAC